MVVEDIPTLLEEAFVVEVVTPLVVAPMETIEAAGPPKRMIGTTSPLKKIVVKVVDPICALEESLWR